MFMRCLLPLALLSTAVVSAAPPELDQRPLRANPDEDIAPRAAAADEAVPPDRGDQLFYFNGSERVYLNDTGRAVAKLANDVAEGPLAEARVSLDENDPLADLAPALRESGLAVIRTRGERAFSLEQADNPPPSVEYVLPIVTEEPADSANRNAAVPPDPMIMTNTISVRFSPGLIGNNRQAQAGRVAEYVGPLGLEIVRPSKVPNTFVLQLAEDRVTYQRLLAAANDLYTKGAETGDVLYAKPEFIRVKRRSQQIDDPRFGNQWHLHNTGQGSATVDADVDAREAWTITEGRPEIRVAVIDDSVQHQHPDLLDNYQTGRYYNGFTNPPSHTDDPSPKNSSQRHGTPCAGAAVGRANMIGIRGAAPECGLIGVHFWHSTDSQIAEAFYFCDDPDEDAATDDGAAVVSCSWSLNISPPADLVVALDDLAQNGRHGRGLVILFAAANDNGPIALNQNLARESVLCIGATGDQDIRSWYSNFGPELEVVAPSSHQSTNLRIDTTDNTDPPGGSSGYAVGDYTGTGSTGFGGTSSATPLTAGVCALVLCANPNLTARQVRAILEHTADRVRGGGLHPASYHPTTAHDVNYGYGRVNARSAVLAAQASVTHPAGLWPDHVQDLSLDLSSTNPRLSWQNPADNATGVLIVRAATPVRWRPHDGERYLPGDQLTPDTVVVSNDLREEIEVPSVGGNHFALYVFNEDHKHSWGVAIGSPTQVLTSVATAGGPAGPGVE